MIHEKPMSSATGHSVSMMSSSSCPICDGSGWKTVVSESGKKTQAVKCDCRIANWSERLLNQARIPPRYSDCTLANFSVETCVPNSKLAKALLDAKHYVDEYPLETNGLLLIGPIGIGKTHLAVGIIRELMVRKGTQCLFYDYRELLKEVQNSYNDDVHATELGVLRPVFDAEILVLDELGAVRTTEWVWDTVNYILNTRYNLKKTTIITTNLPDAAPGATRSSQYDSLAASKRDAEDAMRGVTLGDRIGERMRSRLQEMCIRIEMEGEDFRIHKSKSSKLQGANVQFRLRRTRETNS